MVKMELKSSGPWSNPNRIMFYLGMLFVVLGALMGGIGVVIATLTHEAGMLIFGVMFLAIFGGIGGFFALIGYKNLHVHDEVLEQGVVYLGKIFDLEPDYEVLMNGQPCITLVVRFLMRGQIREARVNTGDADVSFYPIGATVAISIHNGLAAFVPGSVSDQRLERESDLMNPDFDPSGVESSLGVTCPNCGANVAVPVGMSRFCPYCDTKLTLTDEGELVRVR